MDWNYWLGRKYDLLQQNANADTTRANAGMISANAGANLDTVRAGLLPAESEANIALTRAQAFNTNEQAKTVAPLARANIFNTVQQGTLYGTEATGNNIVNRGMSVGATFGTAPSGNALLDNIRRRVLFNGSGFSSASGN